MSRVSDFPIQNVCSLLCSEVFVLDGSVRQSLYEAFRSKTAVQQHPVTVHRVHHADQALYKIAHVAPNASSYGIAVLTGAFALHDLAADWHDLPARLNLRHGHGIWIEQAKRTENAVPLVIHVSAGADFTIDSLKLIKDSGFFSLFSGSDSRERQEVALLAHFISVVAQIPVLHVYDFTRPNFSHLLNGSENLLRLVSAGLAELDGGLAESLHLFSAKTLSPILERFASLQSDFESSVGVLNAFDAISKELFEGKFKPIEVSSILFFFEC
jgi:hypothetical protein